MTGLLTKFPEWKWTLRGEAAGKGAGNKHCEQQDGGRFAVTLVRALPALAAAEVFLAHRGKGQSIRKEKIMLIKSKRIWNAFAKTVTPSEGGMWSKYKGTKQGL